MAASGQGLLPGIPASATGCDVATLRTAHELTFRQRACYYTDRLLKPSMALRAMSLSSFDLLRDSPHERTDGLGSLGQRFSIFYASHAAESTGALLAGYFNHEDPRFHPSGQTGVWNRANSALFSVLLNQNHDSETRLALAPIAGAFGAGFAGMACYPMHNRLREGLLWTGASYGGSFGTALLKEFQPDLANYIARHRRRRKERLLSEP
jgi:hypothetical protein